jgi:hypothetical protein
MDDETLTRPRHVLGDNHADVIQAASDPIADRETEPEHYEGKEDWDDEDDWDDALEPEEIPHP